MAQFVRNFIQNMPVLITLYWQSGAVSTYSEMFENNIIHLDSSRIQKVGIYTNFVQSIQGPRSHYLRDLFILWTSQSFSQGPVNSSHRDLLVFLSGKDKARTKCFFFFWGGEDKIYNFSALVAFEKFPEGRLTTLLGDALPIPQRSPLSG